MSSWGPKLEKKLKALADGASKESLQALATWIVFNRKHTNAFCQVLLDALKQTHNEEKEMAATSSSSREWLYWQVINEVLLANQTDAAKWERASELRLALGESTILSMLEQASSYSKATVENLEVMLKEWDKVNAFGGPTLIGQIKRALLSTMPGAQKRGSNNTDTDTNTDVGKVQSNTTPAVPVSSVDKSSDETAAKKKVSPVASIVTNTDVIQERRNSLSSVGSGTRRRGSMASVSEVKYDFESKNIPHVPVDARSFLDPCKAVATLQIARDVRNDTPVQIHSLITNLPQDIKDKVEEVVAASASSASNDGGEGEKGGVDLDVATIRDFSIRMPKAFLEMDLAEQTQTIQTFQEIIRKQRAAREKLIYLLIQSRCQFGSQEAAKQYFELTKTSETLKAKKRLLEDALELEGLDSEFDRTDYEKPLEDLSPLSWYEGNDANSDKDGSLNKAKRQKTV